MKFPMLKKNEAQGEVDVLDNETKDQNVRNLHFQPKYPSNVNSATPEIKTYRDMLVQKCNADTENKLNAKIKELWALELDRYPEYMKKILPSNVFDVFEEQIYYEISTVVVAIKLF